MQAEAKRLGHQLVYTDAAGSAAKQVADVNSMIAQGVDAIFLAPREEKPLIPAVMAGREPAPDRREVGQGPGAPRAVLTRSGQCVRRAAHSRRT